MAATAEQLTQQVSALIVTVEALNARLGVAESELLRARASGGDGHGDDDEEGADKAKGD